MDDIWGWVTLTLTWHQEPVEYSTCIDPLAWPVKRYRLGRDPILVEPSHSWMQKADIVLPSTDFIRQILQPNIDKLLVYYPKEL